MLDFLGINDLGDLLVWLFVLAVIIFANSAKSNKNGKKNDYTIKKSNVYKNYDSKGRKIR